MPVVFVTDASQRKAVPIIRSLGRRGIDVIAGDSTRWSMGFYSKYCADAVVYPSPLHDPERFVDWLVAFLVRHHCDVLLPIDERSMGAVTAHLAELRKLTAVPVVDWDTYGKARDKAQTMRIARQIGVDCPETSFVSDLESLGDLAARMTFPVVIKPREGQGSRGVVYVQNRDDLSNAYRHAHERQPFPLLQEFIPPGGGSFGVGALLDDQNEPLALFAHKRLREYPISGGPSTLSESVLAPELIQPALRLLKALKWSGVAMVEFKVDPRDGLPKLMEVNPKFWGSIGLAIASGVDFPFLLYQWATGKLVEPVVAYRVGTRCRWLVGDLLHMWANPQRFRLDPPFVSFLKKDQHDDLLSWDDPVPVLGMIIGYCSLALRSGAPDLRR